MITKVEFKKFNFTEKPSLKQGYKVRYRGKELSDKQVRVLEYLAVGADNDEISSSLRVSRRTVETHIHRIRDLLSKELGYRLGERELVLFAKDMLEGFKVFLSLEAELEAEKEKFTIIDDWDDDEETRRRRGGPPGIARRLQKFQRDTYTKRKT